MSHTSEILIDLKTFESFKKWSGQVPSGYWANWLGVLTRANVWAFPEEIITIYSEERNEDFDYPINDEHVLDWVPMLEAVLHADECFVMVALGAGWGRWLSGGAFAATQKRLTYRLVGVEAEPEHFRWMETHLKENKLDPGSYRLINAASSSHRGECWFYVGKPSSWYGQSIVQDEKIPLKNKQSVRLGAETEFGGEKVRRVRSVNIEDIVADLQLIDYMHMDIQGAEYDFLSAKPDLLQTRLKMVNVGTHSEKIENNLQRLFEGLGWVNRFNVPMNSELPVKIGDKRMSTASFGDGVQVWINPMLT